MSNENEKTLPIDAYLVALNLTEPGMIDDADESFIEEVRDVFLFDKNQVTYCCELTPSYWLIYCYSGAILSEAGCALSGYERQRLADKYEAGPMDEVYMHCHKIDGILDGKPSHVRHYPTAGVSYDDIPYDEQMENLREHFACNRPL